jgi:hypothetical protein
MAQRAVVVDGASTANISVLNGESTNEENP